MNLTNVEIKARCPHPDRIRQILKAHKADYKGTDHQIDTYFKVPDGRLKLREGGIENNLIFYRRSNTRDPKKSDINLVSLDQTTGIKALLTNALETKIVVDKRREIYFINNVKFHIDQVKTLGSFVEIEAIDEDNSIGEERLRTQCEKYMQLMGIAENDLLAHSYADLLAG